MTSPSTSTICSGVNANFSLSANTSSTFSWQATATANVNGETTVSTSGNIITDVLTNTTTIPQNVIYTVTPTAAGCAGAPQTVTITVNPLPIISLGPDTSICQAFGQAILYAQTSIQNGTYSWSNGSIDSVINVSPQISTIYSVIYSLNGCSSTDSIIVNIIQNQSSIFLPVNPICEGDFLNPLPAISLNGIQGSWNPPVNNSQTTSYIFTPNQGVCAWDTTISIQVNPIPILISSNDFFTCKGDEVTVSSTPDIPNGEFLWSNSNTSNSFSFTSINSQILTVTYTLNGCASEPDTVIISVGELPISHISANGSTVICQDAFLTLTSNYSNNILWSTNETSNSISVSQTGIYFLTITDSLGCQGVDSIEVINTGIPCLEIGSVFTPNGDGINDIWSIPGIEYYQNAIVEILNRWGQQLFFSNGYAIPWDGTYNGEKLPVGDYFYIINLGNNTIYKGSMTLKY